MTHRNDTGTSTRQTTPRRTRTRRSSPTCRRTGPANPRSEKALCRGAKVRDNLCPLSSPSASPPFFWGGVLTRGHLLGCRENHYQSQSFLPLSLALSLPPSLSLPGRLQATLFMLVSRSLSLPLSPESVASYLVYADVRLRIPMTRIDDRPGLPRRRRSGRHLWALRRDGAQAPVERRCVQAPGCCTGERR